MKKIIKEKIKKLFINNNGYAQTREIVKANINKRNIRLLLEEGKISRIKRGLYKWNDFKFEPANELVDVLKIVPSGVICLTSAISYYGLTTFTPLKYEVAITQKAKVVLPRYPEIKLVYFSKKIYTSGITEEKINNHKIKIYEMEKAICDCIRYRNKIGKDIILEAIKEYIKRKDKNIEKIMKYAKICKVEDLLKKYLEILI